MGMLRFSRVLIVCAVLTGIMAFSGCGGGGGSSDGSTSGEASDKAITSFSFQVSENPSLDQDVMAEIDEPDHRIMLHVPVYSSGNSLCFVASFATSGATVSVNGMNQESGSTENDFSAGPLIYRVTSLDGSCQDYTVSIKTMDCPESFSSFSLLAQNNAEAGLGFDVRGRIDESSRTIVLTVPEETAVKNLVPTFTVSGAPSLEETGITVLADSYLVPANSEQRFLVENALMMTSGVTGNDFSKPLNFRITRYPFLKDYTVIVEKKASAKALTSFRLMAADNWRAGLKCDVLGDIDERHRRIYLPVPADTDITRLAATFSATESGVSVNGAAQASGCTINDFTHPVIFTVSARDGSSAGYSVIVTRSVSPASTPAFPFVVMGGNGNALVVSFGRGISSIRYRDGKWETPETIFSQDVSFRNVKFASAGNGEAIITWEQPVTNETKQLFKLEYRGGEWKAPAAVCPPVSWLNNLLVKMDDSGNTALVWEEYGESNLTRYKTEYRGGIWNAPVAFSYQGESPRYNNGVFADVWKSGTQLFTRYFHDGAWDAALAITTDGGSIGSFDSALGKDGSLIVAWEQNCSDEATGYSRSMIFRCEVRNGIAGTPELLSSFWPEAMNPNVAINGNGDAVIAWAQMNPQDLSWEICRTERHEGAWSIPEPAGPPFMRSYYSHLQELLAPRISMNAAGDAVIVWYDQRRIYSCKKTNGSWGLPESVAIASAPFLNSSPPTAYFMGAPQAAISGDGTACIVWSQNLNAYGLSVRSVFE